MTISESIRTEIAPSILSNIENVSYVAKFIIMISNQLDSDALTKNEALILAKQIIKQTQRKIKQTIKEILDDDCDLDKITDYIDSLHEVTFVV